MRPSVIVSGGRRTTYAERFSFEIRIEEQLYVLHIINRDDQWLMCTSAHHNMCIPRKMHPYQHEQWLDSSLAVVPLLEAIDCIGTIDASSKIVPRTRPSTVDSILSEQISASASVAVGPIHARISTPFVTSSRIFSILLILFVRSWSFRFSFWLPQREY